MSEPAGSQSVPAEGLAQSADLPERLWRLWDQGQRPDVDAFLAGAGPLSPGELAAVLRVDQRARWRAGVGVPAEAYLARYPALQADRDAAFDLVYNEFLLRAQGGERPSLQEYLQRFPQYADVLPPQIELGRALALDASDPEGTVLAQTPTAAQKAARGDRPAAEVSPPRETDALAPPLAAGPLSHWPAMPGYELLGVLGRGGMGVVYKARDVRLKRLVALKMLLAGAHAGPDELARFRAEAEAVARLQHPNIVQIFEVGDQDGRPFFALEYVAGGSLDRRLAGTPQPARAAAELLEVLARAVDAAHRHGIVHRDLKPANILLQTTEHTENTEQRQKKERKETPERPSTFCPSPPLSASVSSVCSAVAALPKISDFGLAKQLDGSGQQTPSGAILGTPSYMAPEQALGKARTVGPAADIYALGAILYEMLIGRPPFKGETPLDTLAQVVADEPVPPRRLQPKVPADLETICLKCLQKHSAKRYATAEALADDLRRFLAGEPVWARPVGSVERLWRWCRRQPAVASLTLALVLLLCGGFGAVTGLYLHAREQAVRAERERDRAEENFRLSLSAVEKYLASVGDSPELKAHGLEKLRRTLLATAREFYEQFARERADDPALRADLGRAYLRLGSISKDLGEHEQAVELFGRMRDTYAELARDRPDEPSYLENLAGSHHNLGLTYQELGRWADALASHQEARRLRALLVGNPPRAAHHLVGLAESHVGLTRVYSQQGQWAEAEANYQEAQRIGEQLIRERPEAPGKRLALASFLESLAGVSQKRGQLREAQANREEARRIHAELAREHPTDPYYQDALATSQFNLAQLYATLGRHSEAVAIYQETAKLWGRLAQEHPYVLQYQGRWADCQLNLGDVHIRAGQWAEAATALQEARHLYARLTAAQPKVLDYRHMLAMSCFNLGITHYQREQWSEAGKVFREGCDHLVALVREHPGNVEYQSSLANLHNALASVHQATGQHLEAEAAYREALTVQERLVRDQPKIPDFRRDLASTHHNLGMVYEGKGQLSEAETAYRAARALLEQLVRDHPNVPQFQDGLANTINGLGSALSKAGRKADAEGAYRDACRVYEELVRRHPDVNPHGVRLGHVYRNLALVVQDQGQPEASLDWLAKAVQWFEGVLQRQPDNAGARASLRDALWARAGAHNRRGQPADALKDCDRALQLDAGEQRVALRALRAYTLARLGQLAEALAAADELSRASFVDGSPCFDLAGLYALAAAAVATDTQLTPVERAGLAERHAARAVELLSKAAAAGSFKDAARVELLRTDNDFQPLRLRADFQKLLSEVEKNARANGR